MLAVASLTPTRRGEDLVDVQLRVSFTRMLTPEERKSRPRMPGKYGEQMHNMHEIARLIGEHKRNTGQYPKTLKELNQALPKDVFSPTGEDYHYEFQHRRFILSGCGKDGVHGNNDDNVIVGSGNKQSSGLRGSLVPDESDEDALGQRETAYGDRPKGNCSLGGRIVSAETDQPLSHATVHLLYVTTVASFIVEVAEDGTFVFKDIPEGPYMLRTTGTTGYQEVIYNPDGKPDQHPQFTLDKGEQRRDLVLKAKPAYRISGKIRDTNDEVPVDCQGLMVWAWNQRDGRYGGERGFVKPTDGSYVIDGLDGEPVFVMVVSWQAEEEGRHFPPVYYPSTFSRNQAKKIVFGENRTIENVDISLRTEGGLTLEGKVVDQEGHPVPEALVMASPSDTPAGRSGTYSDEHGRYQIRGLGDGEFLIHVDAAHRGYVRTRTTVQLDGTNQKTTRDFNLTKGILISGRLVDKAGNDWESARSFGFATVGDATLEDRLLGRFCSNKFAPKSVSEFPSGSLSAGEGVYLGSDMIFPTKSTFVIQGMKPGLTRFEFQTAKQGQEVLEIRYKDRDILESGLQTTPGVSIEDVVIVIGNK